MATSNVSKLAIRDEQLNELASEARQIISSLEQVLKGSLKISPRMTMTARLSGGNHTIKAEISGSFFGANKTETFTLYYQSDAEQTAWGEAKRFTAKTNALGRFTVSLTATARFIHRIVLVALPDDASNPASCDAVLLR